MHIKNKNILNKKWFSIIEILVGIFIFSLGISSVYAIISSTLRLNDYNENYIIASNLAREQIELVRNIRDSNYKKIQIFDKLNPNSAGYNINDRFEYWKKYIIENNYSTTATFPIKIKEISGFVEWTDKLSSMWSYNLCIDSDNRYTYECLPASKKTKFYKYISAEKVKYKNEDGSEKIIDNAYLVTSKVIWYIKWYHEFEVKYVIADWKRL